MLVSKGLPFSHNKQLRNVYFVIHQIITFKPLKGEQCDGPDILDVLHTSNVQLLDGILFVDKDREGVLILV